MRILYRASVLAALMLFIAACGNVASPQYESERIIADAEAEATHIIETAQAGGDVEEVDSEDGDGEVEIADADATVAAAEAEVDDEATEETDDSEVEIADADATVAAAEAELDDEATEEVADTDEDTDTADSDVESEIMAAVDDADSTAGQTTFQTIGCAGCHMTTDMQMVGPGLGGLYDRAGERVEGQGPYEYIFTSIRNSQAFIVEGYPAGVMIQYTEELLSDEDIYNIMAYLHQFSE